MRTRIKVCGITRREDVQLAAELGIDAIGLVFAPGSPRRIDAARARSIVEALPAFMSAVGLFMDNDPEDIRRILGEVPLHLLQFHGRESSGACSRWGRPYVKALPMGGRATAEELARQWPSARAFLLDAHRSGQPGGTGTTFDWARVPQRLPRPVILAGGLTPDNVAEAVQRVRPWAVDVSSGVETAPGVKDAALVEAFVTAVHQADDATGT